MAYCTPDEVADYLGLTDPDLALSTITPAAQAWIDGFCHRTFEAAADSTRYFEPGRDTLGRTLYLDEDLCQIADVVVNLDNGAGGETLATTDYATEPRNRAPYYALEMRIGSSKSWRYTRDPVDAVSVEGRWAYSLTAPAAIKQACIRLAAYMYRQKDSQVFDVTAMPESGQMIIPKGMPADVKQLLAPYVKARL